jgi:hypothetical protein
VSFDSVNTGGRGGRNAGPLPAPGTAAGRGRGRGAPGGFGGGAATIGYPRAFDVQVSADGKKWSKPVASGRGDGSHTTIAFKPVQAKFVRITQTDNLPDAPAWSIRNLRVYEAKAGAK